MKKRAIIVDFGAKIIKDYKMSNKYDIYIIDRFNNKIVDVECSEGCDFHNPFQSDFSFEDFYRLISKKYKEVFCLFVSYNCSNIDDYLINNKINKERNGNDCRIFTYLLDIMTQNKKTILDNTVQMIEKGFPIRDIIVRIHKIRTKDAFSVSDLLTKYITYMV